MVWGDLQGLQVVARMPERRVLRDCAACGEGIHESCNKILFLNLFSTILLKLWCGFYTFDVKSPSLVV